MGRPYRRGRPLPDLDPLAFDDGPGAFAFACHGVVIGVQADDARVLAAVRAQLPVGSVARAGATHAAAIYRFVTAADVAAQRVHHVLRVSCSHDGRTRRLARADALSTAIRCFRRDAEFRVALHAPACVFVHAAAVAHAGRAIVVPAHSRAGKSTLAAALVRAGAAYLSDEYAVLAPDGLVHPFARDLHLRTRDGQGRQELAVSSLGGVVAQDPLPLGLVVVTGYQPGARWRPRRLSTGRTALALVAHAVRASVDPSLVLERIGRALRPDVIGLRGARGEAEETAHLLLRRAERTFAP